MSTVPSAAATGSVPLAQRAGGPDLARGLALLGIGLANIVGWLHGEQWTALLKQAGAAPVDRAADVLIGLLADNRGFPLFALLFGYGLGILYRRSRARGERPGRYLLRMLRRSVVLAGIGILHGILLFSGDILVPYAIIGMLCAVLLTRRPAVLILAAVVTLPALGVWGWTDGTTGLSEADGYASASAGDYAGGLQIRAHETLRGMALAVLLDIGLLSPMALGALAARIHLLEQVALNRDLLRPLSRWGLGIGLIGAIPLVMVLVVDPRHVLLGSESVLGALGVLHQLTGVATALGVAAAAALLAERVRVGHDAGGASALRRAGDSMVRATEALGATALSVYIAQSVVFLALFPPYTLDLGARLGTAGAALIVLVSWLAMLPCAAALRRAGRRGPLEAVLRRLAAPRSRA